MFESAGTYECRSSGSVHVTLGVIVLGEFTASYHCAIPHATTQHVL